MEIRPGIPEDSDPFEDDELAPMESGPLESVKFRADRSMIAYKIVGILVFGGVPQLFNTNLISKWFGAIVAVGLVIYLVRDLVAPSRLSADKTGIVVVSGYAGHRTLDWNDVDGLRVDQRRRSGFLEIETASSLHLFSRYDLSMPPQQALEMLERVRPNPAPEAAEGDTSVGP